MTCETGRSAAEWRAKPVGPGTAGAGERGHGHPVDHHLLVHRPPAVDGREGEVVAGAAADILRDVQARIAHVHAPDERGEVGEPASRRDRVDELACDHFDLIDVLDVDNRTAALNRDGFFNRADSQFGVHRGSEPDRQLDAVTSDRGETRELKRHAVDARAQVSSRLTSWTAFGGGRA